MNPPRRHPAAITAIIIVGVALLAAAAAACSSGSSSSSLDVESTIPTITPELPSAAASIAVTMTGSDTETCDLTFEIGTVNSGSVGEITDEPCVEGSPNRDSASVTFTADPGVCGPGEGSFTYTTNDGQATSPPATVTVDVPCIDVGVEE